MALPVNPNPGENSTGRGSFGWAPPSGGGLGFGATASQQAAQDAQAARNRMLAAQYGQQAYNAMVYSQGGSRSTTGGSATSPMATGQGAPSGLLGAASQGVGGLSMWQTPDTVTTQSPVFMGMQSIGGQNRPSTQALGDVINSWYTMSQSEKDKFEAQLASAGYRTETFTDQDFFKAWSSYASQAAAYNAAGKMVSPWDMLSLDQRQKASAKPVTTTNVSKSYNISNYEDTHALFLNAAQSLLGRAPTAAETKAFQKQLNAYERANPNVTTTTQTTNGLGSTSSTSTTSGGVTAAAMQDLAQQAAQQNPEYGSYQAATTYFNSLLSAIGHM